MIKMLFRRGFVMMFETRTTNMEVLAMITGILLGLEVIKCSIYIRIQLYTVAANIVQLEHKLN